MSTLRRIVRAVLVLAGVALVSFSVLSPLFNLATIVEFLTNRRMLLVRITALLAGFLLLLLSFRLGE